MDVGMHGLVETSKASKASAEVAAWLSDLCARVETRALRFNLDLTDAAVVAWDTESTSLVGVAVQLGVVVYDAVGNELAAESRLLAPLPGHEIEPRAEAVHGISNERLRREGEPAAVCIEAFNELTARCDARGVPVVAHNAPFDVRVMRRTAAAAGASFREFDAQCTLSLARRAHLPPPLKLQNVYESVTGRAVSADVQLHDACEDSRLCAALFCEGRRRSLW